MQDRINIIITEKAKEKLSIAELTVSEIVIQLGFEHPKLFKKLSKSKANTSSLEFRSTFN